MKMSVYDEEECFILFCFHSFDLLLNTDFFSCITAIIFMNTIKVRLYFAAVRNVLNCLIIEECFFVIPLKKKKLSFFLFFLSNVYIGFGGDMNSSSQPAGILLWIKRKKEKLNLFFKIDKRNEIFIFKQFDTLYFEVSANSCWKCNHNHTLL